MVTPLDMRSRWSLIMDRGLERGGVFIFWFFNMMEGCWSNDPGEGLAKSLI